VARIVGQTEQRESTLLIIKTRRPVLIELRVYKPRVPLM
jgi:hypothetical protein